jgi:hypothetical protein
MISVDSVELLNNRLDFVEISVFGKATADPSELPHLRERLDALSVAARNLESEIPQMSACRELLLKLKPQICKSKSSLAVTIERLETAVAMRRELEDTVDMLLSIEGTAQSANISSSTDIAQYQEELTKVESLLRPLIALSNEQSDEIDSFLSTYENAVLKRIIILHCFYHCDRSKILIINCFRFPSDGDLIG